MTDRNTAVVTALELHVRNAPGKENSVVEIVKQNARLDILDRQEFNGGKYVWLKVGVVASGNVGWCDASFVRIEAAPAPTPYEPYPEQSPDWRPLLWWAGGIGGGLAILAALFWR